MLENTASKKDVFSAILYLLTAALLFSVMGICVRYASTTVDHYTTVFFRNVVGMLIFIPMLFQKGINFFKTDQLWMHTWRSVIGLTSMYAFFYALAHLKLSNAMVFSYSSPIFIPLIAWLFLKERISKAAICAALIGLIGVLLVAKPDQGMLSLMSLVGLLASFCSAMAFVTVRALTDTEPVERIVFYFCLIGSAISAVPALWHWHHLSWHALSLLVIAGLLANISQLFMSKAYSLAPASQIGPVNYVAIIFAVMWGYLFWHELPDRSSIYGFVLILISLLLCNLRLKSSKRLSVS